MGVTEWMAALGTQVIGAIGYAGIFLLMVAESMVLPVPSEAVMPFAGFLVEEGTLDAAAVIAFATLGSIAGSLIGYAIGRVGGKGFVDRYGRYLLLDAEDLERIDRFFSRRGPLTVFVSRFIPVVRHLISIPAGFARMPLVPFVAFTVAGAGLWNAFLTWCGFVLRKNWQTLLTYSHIVDVVVLAAIAVLLVVWVARHLKKRKKAAFKE